MKNNISYFSHDCNSSKHDKFKALRGKFGWAGEGRFWALNGIIGHEEGCVLDLRKLRKKGSVADDLGMSYDEFDAFIEFLISDDCELLYLVDGCITTERCQDTLIELQGKRESARERKKKKAKVPEAELFPTTLPSTPELQTNTTEQQNNSPEKRASSLLKESKVKESIVDESKEENEFDDKHGFDQMQKARGMPFLELKEMCRQVLHRDAPNAPLTYFEEVDFKKLMQGYGEEKMQNALEVSVAEGWRSLSSIRDYLQGKLKPKSERYGNSGGKTRAAGEYASRVGFTVGQEQADELADLHRKLAESP